MYQLILAILVLVIPLSSIAELSFSRNARTFELQHLNLVTKGLAGACLTMDSLQDGMLCNPSMTSLYKKPSLGAQLQLSNGYASYGKVKQITEGQLTEELIDQLFTDGQVVQIETLVDLNFRSPYLFAQYTPFSLKGLTAVRNEANPEAEISAFEETGLTLQSGYEFFEGFHLGIQTRILERKFVKQRFKLLVLGTDEGKNILKPKQQSVQYFDPAATWIISNNWKPKLSLMVMNLGFSSEQYDEFPEPVEPQLAVGLSPPVGWGDLDLELAYRSMTYEESDLNKLRFGALYRFGSMNLTSGIDNNGASAGVYYTIDKFNSGILYSTTKTSSEEQDFYSQTVYVQLGWQI